MKHISGMGLPHTCRNLGFGGREITVAASSVFRPMSLHALRHAQNFAGTILESQDVRLSHSGSNNAINELKVLVRGRLGFGVAFRTILVNVHRSCTLIL